MENTGYTLSDISAVTNGMGGLGGGNSLVTLLLLFALISGGGFWGNRGDYGQYATAASQQEVLFNQHFNNLDNKMDRGFTSIGNGIADATFALNNTAKDGFYATQTAIKDCCCTTQRNIDSVRFDMSNFANAINANIDSRFAALEKAQMQAQIDAQAQQINQLNLAQQLCGVVRYPNQMVYAQTGSPFCNYNGGCGYGNI